MTASHTPLIIEVRANEFADRTGNAAIPYGSDAIVSDALDSVAAGATMYHWHARGEDGIDRPNDVDLHRAVATRLRGETDLILHPTMGFVATQGNAAGRAAPILELMRDPVSAIDIVPVDFGAFISDEWDTPSRRFASGDRVLLNKTGYLRELLVILRDHAIPVLAVVWSPGGVRTALALRDEGLLSSPTFWLLGFTSERVPGGPPATARQLDAFLDVLPPEEPWSVHVRDGDGLAMAAMAVLRGGHVSIGLGDDPYKRLGFPTNSDLVRRVAHLAETIGRPVATQAQARAITGLHRSPVLRGA